MKNNAPASLSYGFAPSVFGECCMAFDESAIYALLFSDSPKDGLADLKKRFPSTSFKRWDEHALTLSELIFSEVNQLVLKPIGTDFQLAVWNALRQIPYGATATYADIAAQVGKPRAVRAVGTAIGANPIAYLIPCHRVLRTDGGMGGYRWGLDLKKQLLEWEHRQ